MLWNANIDRRNHKIPPVSFCLLLFTMPEDLSQMRVCRKYPTIIKTIMDWSGWINS